MSKRYRVRAGNKDFTDPGPDLLRTRENAYRAIRGQMGPAQVDNWFFRTEEPKGFDDWSKPLSKSEVLNKVVNWTPNKDGLTFQFGRKDKDKIEPTIVVKFEVIKDLSISCNERAEVIHSLVHHQFPGCAFGGGFVCKQIEGSSAWSDHAWRDAVDESFYEANDRGTDWVRRMASSRNIECDYILGSRAGQVGMSSAPDFGWSPGGPSSHEWHVHVSAVDHHGSNPRC